MSTAIRDDYLEKLIESWKKEASPFIPYRIWISSGRMRWIVSNHSDYPRSVMRSGVSRIFPHSGACRFRGLRRAFTGAG